MAISSKIHKQAGTIQHAIIDVLADGKPILAALVLGTASTFPPQLSDVGNACLRRLEDALDATTNKSDITVVEIKSTDAAQAQVTDIAERIDRRCAVVFVCHDGACYDAVWDALNVSVASLK